MFQEVCCAIISLILIAAAGVDPQAHLENNRNYYVPQTLLLLYDNSRVEAVVTKLMDVNILSTETQFENRPFECDWLVRCSHRSVLTINPVSVLG